MKRFGQVVPIVNKCGLFADDCQQFASEHFLDNDGNFNWSGVLKTSVLMNRVILYNNKFCVSEPSELGAITKD